MQEEASQNSKFEIQKGTVMVRYVLFAFCLLHFALLTACAKAKAAELVPDGPPLAMSVPPPRVITPVEQVVIAEPLPPPAPEPAAAPPPRPAARPPARVESKPEPATPATPPTPPPTASAEPREVRSVPAAAAASEERKVRDLMTRASRDLTRVDYQKLSSEGKSNYEQSKRFSEQAEQALKEKNFVFAMASAEKAATLAAELAGR